MMATAPVPLPRGAAISASIIAAVRLAREDISTPSPRVVNAIGDSIALARMILRKVVGNDASEVKSENLF